jgi:hypothetical protein
MVAVLQVKPVSSDLRIVNLVNGLGECIERVKGIFLQIVSQPGGQIAFFIGPGPGLGDMNGCGRFKFLF